ncbi:alpha/beta hydrolase [Streptomyces sp. NPDC048272]|uniref:alpha/beta hydrolase n=1 Tax=Streptomyces sp. NPDC048272 TaxID=3154616 RepID=UPI0033FE7158
MSPGSPHVPAAPGRELPSALSLRRNPADPTAAILVLHGGRADGLTAPPALNLPLVRMRAFTRALARATGPHRVVVAEVRYRHRGWNGAREDPVRDTVRALDELRRAVGAVPVVLVGHSMGGRAALRAAGDPAVRAVIGLAPWCPPGEPVTQLAGKSVVLLHDEADRVTDARATWGHVRRARAGGARAAGIVMPEGGHAMLRRSARWHGATVAAALGLLGSRELPDGLFTGPVPMPWPRPDGVDARCGAGRRPREGG